MDLQRLRYLLNRHLNGELTSAEQLEWEEILSSDHELEVKALIDEAWIRSGESSPSVFNEDHSDKTFLALKRKITPSHDTQASRMNIKRRIGVAAAVLLVFTVGYIYIFTHIGQQPTAVIPQPLPSIGPGSDGAVLTLSDGTEIVLDNVMDGPVIEESGTTLAMRDGMLVYENTAPQPVDSYNTVTTPRGRQFKLKLPDGSKVWLNAASSITYPLAFTKSIRSVSVTGEVYFEVETDQAKPFIVSNDDLSVKVTGTIFNMNTYADESRRRVTLLEGGVVVTRGDREAKLVPGQEVLAEEDGRISLSSDVNTEQAVAWKNGYFSFDNTYLYSMMRMIARWYDVEVVYEGTIPSMKFGGEISRDTPLEQVLLILQESNIRFSIDYDNAERHGRIIVSP